MSLILRLKKFFQNKQSKFLLIISILFSMFIIYLSQDLKSWTIFFGFLDIPVMWPSFADLRSHQSLVLTVEQNLNPYLENPNDPWKRVINYPFIWYYISNFLNWQSEIFFKGFLFFTISFYTFCFFKIFDQYFKEKMILSYVVLLFFSTSSLLAIERGNTDMIIFIIVILLCYSKNYLLSFFLYLTASLLKIYPLLTIFLLIKITKFLMCALATLGIIFFFNINYLDLYISNTSSSNLSGIVYGVQGLINGVPKLIERLNLTIFENINFLFLLYIIIIFLLIFSFFIGMNLKISRNKKELFIEEKLFLSGSAIYVGTYLTMSSFDYRLIFLFLTLPYLFTKKKNLLLLIFHFLFFISLNSILFFSFANDPIDFVIIGILVHICKFFILIYITFISAEIIKNNINQFIFYVFKIFLLKK